MNIRRQVARLLKRKKLVKLNVNAPIGMVEKVHYFIELCLNSGLSLNDIYTIIFGLGYDIFELSIVEGSQIKTLQQLMMIARYVRKTLKEFMMNSDREFVLDATGTLSFINFCKINKVKELDFMIYIEKERSPTVDLNKIILMKSEIELLGKAYLNDK